MTIKELYEALQDGGLLEKLKGELILHGKFIVWTYDIIKNSEEIGDDNEEGIDMLIEEDEYNYNDYESTEELLRQAYDEDLESIQDYINDLGDCIDRAYSDPKMGKTTISFRIF